MVPMDCLPGIQSKATIGDDFQADVTTKGKGYGVYGVYAGHYTNTGSSVDGTDITFKGNAQENLVASDSYQIFGNYFNASSLHLGGNEDISIEANGKFNHISGVYMLNPGADSVWSGQPCECHHEYSWRIQAGALL